MEYAMGMTKKKKKFIIIEEEDDKEKKIYDIVKVIRIQRWWRTRIYFFFNKIKSINYCFSNLGRILRMITRNRVFYQFRIYFNYIKFLNKLRLLQRNCLLWLYKRRLLTFTKKLIQILIRRLKNNIYLTLKNYLLSLYKKEILKNCINNMIKRNLMDLLRKNFKKFFEIIKKIKRVKMFVEKLQKILQKIAINKNLNGSKLIRYLYINKISKERSKIYKSLENIYNRKRMIEAIKKYLLIINNIKKRQQKACERFLISKSKIYLRFYFDIFKNQVNNLKEKYELRKRLLKALFDKYNNNNKKYFYNKFLYKWKYLNYYSKIYERNKYFSNCVQKLCLNINLFYNSEYFINNLKSHIIRKNKQFALKKIIEFTNKNDEIKKKNLMIKKFFQYFSKVRNQEISFLRNKYFYMLIKKINNKKEELEKQRILFKWKEISKKIMLQNISEAFFKMENIFNFGPKDKNYKTININIYKNTDKFLNNNNVKTIVSNHIKNINQEFNVTSNIYGKDSDYFIFFKKDYSTNKNKHSKNVEELDNIAKIQVNSTNSYLDEKDKTANAVDEIEKNNFYLYDEKNDKFYLANKIINKNDYDSYILIILPNLNLKKTIGQEKENLIIKDSNTINQELMNESVCSNSNKNFLNNKFEFLMNVTLYLRKKGLKNMLNNFYKNIDRHNQFILKKYFKLWNLNKDKISHKYEKMKLFLNSFNKTNKLLNISFIKRYFFRWKEFSKNIFNQYIKLASLIKIKILNTYFIPVLNYCFITKAKDNIIVKILNNLVNQNKKNISLIVTKWKIKNLQFLNFNNLKEIKIKNLSKISLNSNLRILQKALNKWKIYNYHLKDLYNATLNFHNLFFQFIFRKIIQKIKYKIDLEIKLNGLIKKKEHNINKLDKSSYFYKWVKFNLNLKIFEIKKEILKCLLNKLNKKFNSKFYLLGKYFKKLIDNLDLKEVFLKLLTIKNSAVEKIIKLLRKAKYKYIILKNRRKLLLMKSILVKNYIKILNLYFFKWLSNNKVLLLDEKANILTRSIRKFVLKKKTFSKIYIKNFIDKLFIKLIYSEFKLIKLIKIFCEEFSILKTNNKVNTDYYYCIEKNNENNNSDKFYKKFKRNFINGLSNKEKLINNLNQISLDRKENDFKDLFDYFKFNFNLKKKTKDIDKILLNNYVFLRQDTEKKFSSDNHLNYNKNFDENLCNKMTLENGNLNFNIESNYVYLKKYNSKLSIVSPIFSNISNNFNYALIVNNTNSIDKAIFENKLLNKDQKCIEKIPNFNRMYESIIKQYEKNSIKNNLQKNFYSINSNININNISLSSNSNFENKGGLIKQFHNLHGKFLKEDEDFTEFKSINYYRTLHKLDFFVKRKNVLENDFNIYKYFFKWKNNIRMSDKKAITLQKFFRNILNKKKLIQLKENKLKINQILRNYVQLKIIKVKNLLCYYFHMLKRNSKLLKSKLSIIKIQCNYKRRLNEKMRIREIRECLKHLFIKYFIKKEISAKSKIFIFIKNSHSVLNRIKKAILKLSLEKFRLNAIITNKLSDIIKNKQMMDKTTVEFKILEWKNFIYSTRYFEKVFFQKIIKLKKSRENERNKKILGSTIKIANENIDRKNIRNYINKWKNNIIYTKLLIFKNFFRNKMRNQIKNHLINKKIQNLYNKFANSLICIDTKQKVLILQKAKENRKINIRRNDLLEYFITKQDKKLIGLKKIYSIIFVKRVFKKVFLRKLVFLQKYIKYYFKNVKKLHNKFFLTRIIKITNKKQKDLLKNAFRKFIDFCINFNNYIKIREFKRILIVYNRKRVIQSLEEKLYLVADAFKKIKFLFRLYFIRNIKNILIYINHYAKLMIMMETSSHNKKIGVFSYIKENIQNLKNICSNKNLNENSLFSSNYKNNISYMRNIFLKVSDNLFIEELDNFEKMKNLGNINEKIFDEKIKFFNNLEKKNIVKNDNNFFIKNNINDNSYFGNYFTNLNETSKLNSTFNQKILKSANQEDDIFIDLISQNNKNNHIDINNNIKNRNFLNFSPDFNKQNLRHSNQNSGSPQKNIMHETIDNAHNNFDISKDFRNDHSPDKIDISTKKDYVDVGQKIRNKIPYTLLNEKLLENNLNDFSGMQSEISNLNNNNEDIFISKSLKSEDIKNLNNQIKIPS